jgi:hypothetical protein
MELKIDKCRSCKKPVVWTKTEKLGRNMPVDSDPIYSGNIMLRQPEPGGPIIAITVQPHHQVKRYISHFATCPNRARWRKKGGLK